MENNSLKEYYIKLHSLYNNAVNMLTAINQSLTSNASEVSVEIYENNTTSLVRIPSFLYLDSKIEQLETSFKNLFNMPNSGEAWFNNDGNMYKLEMVRSNTAPLSPDLDYNNLVAGFTNNQFIKDLVSPRTYIKLNINNLPFSINQMYMKKIVLLNTSLYSDLSKLNITTYEEYVAALYNYRKGIDYEEYDTVLNLPIKRDKYISQFNIDYVIEEGTTIKDDISKQYYVLKLNTLEYHNSDDLSEVYSLSIGDHLCLGNELAIYKVTDIDYTLMNVTLTEVIGHIALQPVSENNNMVLTKYNYDYSEFSYIEVPIEENQFIVVFLGTIYNGVRSQLSNALLLDLGTIYMINEDGSYIKDNYGNNINYIDYYNKYCNNIGDLILGLIQTAYPQLSNYNAYQLKQLQESDDLINYVSGTINAEGALKVVPINTHIYEDKTIENIKNYHAQKASIQSSLNTLTENINTTNNTLLTTDWEQETELTQNALHSQLQQYYSERLTLEKQLSAVVNEINTLSTENNIKTNTKYRIRGVTNTKELEIYLKSITNSKVTVIGLEVEYKYKSISKTTTTLTNIDNNIFTDWNRLNNIDKQRKLFFDETTNGFTVDFVNYESISNIIKWNQIDIPINSNEDVIIRIRYKYNVGQPFINLYSPWSEEITVTFPIEYADNVELAQIINTNENDVTTTKFTNKLINDGYEEHITNKIIASNQTFFHMPENIYSGFNTSENNLISLKDKLTSMCNDINVYKELIETENQKKFQVYLQYDGKNIELHTGITNSINIYNVDHISDSFIKKQMNIVIKNTGTVPINLYSILPGNIDVPLVLANNEYYKDKIVNYQRVPIFVNNIVESQTLGQWIYFREYNVYTNQSILYNSDEQVNNDIEALLNLTKKENPSTDILNIEHPQDIFGKNNIQLGMLNKQSEFNTSTSVGFIGFNSDDDGTNNIFINIPKTIGTQKLSTNINDYFYKENTQYNSVLYMYENIHCVVDNTKIYLDDSTSISKVVSSNVTNLGKLNTTSAFDGGFLFVNLENRSQVLTKGGERDNYEIPVGESVSIPIVFEYFLSELKSISKRLMFDIRNSLITNPLNYILELTAHYDSSFNANISDEENNEDLLNLSDGATNY